MAIDIISDQTGEIPGLDFNIIASDGRKVTLTLPVLGSKNVPTGVMALAGAVNDAKTVQEQARFLYQLLESVRGAWPEPGRILWSLDFDAALKVFAAWFDASKEYGFDPKA